jgi:hypothetical protein
MLLYIRHTERRENGASGRGRGCLEEAEKVGVEDRHA